jgi:hypothetical protein
MTPLWTTACELDLLATCLTVYQDYKETLPPAATKCSVCTFQSCLGKCSSELPADAVHVPVYLSRFLCMLQEDTHNGPHSRYIKCAAQQSADRAAAVAAAAAAHLAAARQAPDSARPPKAAPVSLSTLG